MAFDRELETLRGVRIFRVELRRANARDGQPRVLATLTDVTYQRRERAELLRLAHTDILTGLANCHGILLEAQRRTDNREPFDLLYIDLDGLKPINDSLGHRYGDMVLAASAQRMIQVLGPHDKVGRMGGDEFVALVRSGGLVKAEELRKSLANTFELDGVHVLLSASIGCVLAEELPTEPIEERIRSADEAMFVAKRAGKNRIERVSVVGRGQEERARMVHRLIPAALKAGEFRIVTQPIVSISTGKIIKGECLVRWTSPQLGVVSPIDFIPAAEQSGTIRALGQLVLRQATEALTKAGPRAIPLNINLSAREVTLPTLTSDVQQQLSASGISPELITLELTESAMIGRWDLAQSNLDEVRTLGVGVALDDFGTGYSALAVVHQLRVDTLKLDRVLIKDLPQQRPMAVVMAILKMAESLGISVVAEGVETLEQAQALRELGCPYGQGYFWFRPLEVDAFLGHLTSETSIAPS